MPKFNHIDLVRGKNSYFIFFEFSKGFSKTKFVINALNFLKGKELPSLTTQYVERKILFTTAEIRCLVSLRHNLTISNALSFQILLNRHNFLLQAYEMSNNLG